MNTRNVTVDPWSVDPDGIPGTALDACLHAAIAAPSIFNSQPWRFDPGHGSINLSGDGGGGGEGAVVVGGGGAALCGARGCRGGATGGAPGEAQRGGWVTRTELGGGEGLEPLPLRDFGLTRPAEPRRDAQFEPDPALIVLSTIGDTPEHWLRAGQALERTLLTATVRGLATTPMTQPLEIPELRALLTPTGSVGFPQVILRIGYGPASPTSARRPLAEVLIRR